MYICGMEMDPLVVLLGLVGAIAIAKDIVKAAIYAIKEDRKERMSA